MSASAFDTSPNEYVESASEPTDSALDFNGYGRATDPFNGGQSYAHRVAVMLATGQPIPKGHHVHHVCRNKWCVRVDVDEHGQITAESHLQVVTPAQHRAIHAAEDRRAADRRRRAHHRKENQ